MEEWNIQKRDDFCSECKNSFAPKAPCYTVLTFDAEGYQRRDYCAACWNAAGGSMIREKAGVFSHWQGVYAPPPPPPAEPLAREDAESLFKAMAERKNPTELEALFVLAVMLERKKVLKHRETQFEAGDGEKRKLLVYERLRTGEVFIIPDPMIHLDRLPEIQRRVAEIIKPNPGVKT